MSLQHTAGSRIEPALRGAQRRPLCMVVRHA